MAARGTMTESSVAIEALRRCALFAKVDDETLELCVSTLRIRRYRKNETIFHQGDPGDSLYIIERGAVKIVLPSPEGEEGAIIATLGTGDFFGELALLDGAERSATAIAHQATTTLVLRRDVFDHLVDDVPALRHELLAGLAAELRRLTNHVEELFFLDLPGRLARRIVRLAREVDPKPDGAVTLDWRFSQSELAGMIGGSRQTVNRLLGGVHGRGPDPARAGHPDRPRPRPPPAGDRTLSDGGRAEPATGREALGVLRAIALRGEIARRLEPSRPTRFSARSSRRPSPCSRRRRPRSLSSIRLATARLRGRRRRTGPGRHRPRDPPRPGCRWLRLLVRAGARHLRRGRIRASDGPRPADAVRAALDRRGAAGRRARHDRRPRGARQAGRRGLLPPRRRACRSLRAPGGGRHSGQPRRARARDAPAGHAPGPGAASGPPSEASTSWSPRPTTSIATTTRLWSLVEQVAALRGTSRTSGSWSPPCSTSWFARPSAAGGRRGRGRSRASGGR